MTKELDTFGNTVRVGRTKFRQNIAEYLKLASHQDKTIFVTHKDEEKDDVVLISLKRYNKIIRKLRNK